LITGLCKPVDIVLHTGLVIGQLPLTTGSSQQFHRTM
jgi:hypothetical protein